MWNFSSHFGCPRRYQSTIAACFSSLKVAIGRERSEQCLKIVFLRPRDWLSASPTIPQVTLSSVQLRFRCQSTIAFVPYGPRLSLKRWAQTLIVLQCVFVALETNFRGFILLEVLLHFHYWYLTSSWNPIRAWNWNWIPIFVIPMFVMV